jgi:hypothetical protein
MEGDGMEDKHELRFKILAADEGCEKEWLDSAITMTYKPPTFAGRSSKRHY